MAQYDITHGSAKTALQRAQALAAWAGHQWGEADLLGTEATPADIAARTRETTTPGAVGWGITSPDLTERGWYVRVGRAITAEIGEDSIEFEVSQQRRRGVIHWRDGRWSLSYDEDSDHACTFYLMPGRMVARALAVLVVLGLVEDDEDIWVVRDRAGFPCFSDPEADAQAEAEEYWEVRHRAGHLLRGARGGEQ